MWRLRNIVELVTSEWIPFLFLHSKSTTNMLKLLEGPSFEFSNNFFTAMFFMTYRSEMQHFFEAERENFTFAVSTVICGFQGLVLFRCKKWQNDSLSWITAITARSYLESRETGSTKVTPEINENVPNRLQSVILQKLLIATCNFFLEKYSELP